MRASLLLLCTILSFAFAGTSKAVVIWFANVDIPIPTTGSVFVDFETGNFAPTAFPEADGKFVFSGFIISNIAADPAVPAPTMGFVRTAPNNTTVDNLSVGEMVGPGGPFVGAFSDSASHLGTTFTPDVQGYFGFYLEHSTYGTVYGWAEVTLGSLLSSPGVISTFVWQNNGDAIPVGIPEPTAPLLGLLGAGLLAFRRRR